MPNELGLNINKNGDAKPWEQFLAQVKFNIAIGKIKSGTKLPSVQLAEENYGLSLADYKKVINDLSRNGWVEKHDKKRPVVRPHPDGFLPHDGLNTLDGLIIRLLNDAREERCSFEAVQYRINTWYKYFDLWLSKHHLTHFLVVENVDKTLEDENKTALREILVAEIELKTKVKVRVLNTEELKRDSLPENAFPVAVYGRAYDLEKLLPDEQPFFPLRIGDIEGLLKALHQSGAKRIAIVSNKSGYYHEWARKLLSNIDAGNLLRIDTREPGWEEHLNRLCQNPAERPLVVTDLASQLEFDTHPTEENKFRIIKHPFDIYRFSVISDSSLNDLRYIAKFFR